MIQFLIMRFIIVLLVLIAVLAGGVYVSGYTTRKTVSPVAEGAYTRILGVFSIKKDPEALRKKVADAIGDTWKNYSVFVSDLNSGFEMGINEHETFTAASVNKLPIMAVLYNQAQNGKVDFNRIITLQPDDIQDYGTGSIRYDPAGSTYSVKTLIRLMMQKSDNTAAYLLANYVVDMPTVQNIIGGWGLTQTDMVNNTTSNTDMALLLTKIYRGNVANPSGTAEMLGFMENSDFENRIAGDLPKDVIVYHKVGSGDTGEVHDVGIVVHGNTKYYVGILTTGVAENDDTDKLEAKVSRIVYDFMD